MGIWGGSEGLVRDCCLALGVGCAVRMVLCRCYGCVEIMVWCWDLCVCEFITRNSCLYVDPGRSGVGSDPLCFALCFALCYP